MAKTGRPTLYRPEYVDQARRLSMLGMTNEELAKFFEVSSPTINAWMHEHPDFLNALKEGRDIADSRVVESLYKRAIGYSHDEVDIRTVTIPGGGSEIVQTPIIKHYPPDPTSMIFWLKNRRPAQWREKREHEEPDTPVEPVRVQIEVVPARKRDKGAD